MQTSFTEEEIYSRLTVILGEALRVDLARIGPEAKLFSDLGAESLDLLDIRFRVDEAFLVKTSAEDLIRSLGEGLSAEEIDKRLTVRSLVLYIESCLHSKVP